MESLVVVVVGITVTLVSLLVKFQVRLTKFGYSVLFTAIKQTSSMGLIRYSRFRDIFVLSPCALGFVLCNVRNIFLLQMVLVVVLIITLLKLCWISVTD